MAKGRLGPGHQQARIYNAVGKFTCIPVLHVAKLPLLIQMNNEHINKNIR